MKAYGYLIFKHLSTLGLFLALILMAITSVQALPLSGIVITTSNQALTIHTPHKIGGAGGESDQRDIDVYPAIAFDATTRRYLAIWMSGRRASSSSDGLDVYGVLLDQ